MSAITSKGVGANGTPANPTSFFNVGEWVYVVVQVHNPPPGQHQVAIAWLINGQPADLPLYVSNSHQVTGSTNISFAFRFKQAGKGTARIYWDLPPNTPEAQADPFLARDVAFSVSGSTTPTATPAPGATPTPGAAPTPGPTPTPPPTPTPTPSH
jgi:hypothetical protein